MTARIEARDIPAAQVAEQASDDVELVGRPVFEGVVAAGGGDLDATWCARRRFSGRAGETLVTRGDGGISEVLIGAGEPGRVDAVLVRAMGASLARALLGATSAALDLRGVATGDMGVARAAQAAVEGFWGAAYRFDRYRSAEPPSAVRLSLVVGPGDVEAAAAGAERGRIVAVAVSLARDLSNEPAGSLTPFELAAVALEVAAAGGLQATVIEGDDLESERLGGLLGVAAGSAQPPCLIKLVYEPPDELARRDPSGEVPTVALVGKGITFDSGGLSLKTSEGMSAMKTDMSGAAAVIATVGACRALGVAVRVVALAPTTENMPGGRATKPGDVLTTRNGKTIEVLNTDAEGRLVLADALALAAEEAPDAIVDVATLTGACVVALGRKIAGVMGNDGRLVAAVGAASRRAGEATWPLPLPAEYRSDIDSEVADMKNIGKSGSAGALIAGLLLQEFVGDRPWAHLDMGGPSRSEEESGALRKGPTGFGVRTLIELVDSYEPLGSPATGQKAWEVVT